MATKKNIARRSNGREKAKCQCEICSTNLPFELPQHLVEKFISGDLVVFAGAGISTESKTVTPETFFERMAYKYCGGNTSLEFPEVMQAIEAQPAGRINLISEILERIEYVKSFPDMYSEATKFHQELATMWKIDTIVTTNWDDFFEYETGATPFVLSSDIPFWDSARRRVLKVHGSIGNLSTIVASTNDYAASARALSKNLVGAKLKLLFAEKTIVFVGYSLKDSNIKKIFRFVKSILDRHQGQHYFVSPFIDEQELSRVQSLGLHGIKTSGQHFLHTLKVESLRDTCSLSDKIYEEVGIYLEVMESIHVKVSKEFNSTKYPTLMYSMSYQDGVLHALRRIKNMRRLGLYSDTHRTVGTIYKYIEHRAVRLKQKRYEDVAYIDGYMEVLRAIIECRDPQGDAELEIVPYYVFGSKKTLLDLNQFRSEMKKSKSLHKAAWKRANDYVLKHNLPIDGSIIFEHAVAI